MCSHPSTWPAPILVHPTLRPLSGAKVARVRLQSTTRKDRAACGDGKWVKVRDKVVCMIPWQAYASESPTVHELLRHWERQDKARYRWEVRR